MTLSSIDSISLSERLKSGKLPAPEALRYAMLLADSLRRLHEAGKIHGRLTPNHVAISEAGLELLPANEAPEAGPYTPPEVLRGQPADARGDTFSLGTILFEMLTGRQAFEDGNTDAPTPSSGSPTVDKLLRGCLMREPAARYQRLQKLMMELKLLSGAVRRSENPSSARAEAADTVLRAEIAQLESRLAGRLQAQEAGLTALEQGATGALGGFRNQLTGISAQLDEVQSRLAQDDGSSVRAVLQQFEARLTGMQLAAATEANAAAQAAMQQLESRINARLQGYEQRITVMERTSESIAGVQSQLSTTLLQTAAAADRTASRVEELAAGIQEKMLILEQSRHGDSEWMRKVETSLEAAEREGAALRDGIKSEMEACDRAIKAQAAAIESARMATAQTDDLVERVVEALESLQTIVLDSERMAK